jgi:hypothetical protein
VMGQRRSAVLEISSGRRPARVKVSTSTQTTEECVAKGKGKCVSYLGCSGLQVAPLARIVVVLGRDGSLGVSEVPVLVWVRVGY